MSLFTFARRSPRAAGAVPALLLTALVSLPPVARAAWPVDPNLGALPVCTQAATQSEQQVCSDAAGGFIVVWRDYRASGTDIYAQRVNASGVPQWTANGVALCTSANDQQVPVVVPDGSGGAVVAWQDLRSGTSFDVYAQRVNAAGVPQWAANGVVVSAAANGQYSPSIASDGAGGAIVAWVDARVSAAATDVYAQRLNAAGAPQWTANGVALCAAANSQDGAKVVADGLGGAIATWHDYRVVSAAHIYAQRVNGTGAVQWTADGVVICTATGQQTFPQIVTDMAGGAIIGWEDTRNTATTGIDQYAQHVNGSGAVQWTANGVVVTARTGTQTGLHAASDGYGGALFAFTDMAATQDVYAQRLNAGGATAWGSANGIAVSTAAGDQLGGRIQPDGLGGAVLVWYDIRGGVNYDVYGQRVSSTGSLLWTSTGVALSTANAAQYQPEAVADGDGGVFVVWGDTRNSGSADLYAQRLRDGGTLGEPEARILSIRDVPNDQGGWVRVTFTASSLDDLNHPYTQYIIWRSAPTHALLGGATGARREVTTDAAEALHSGKLWAGPLAASDYAWEAVQWVNTSGFSQYSAVVATTSDSLAGSNPRTTFMVQVQDRPSNTYFYYDSAPDSGYSVDNLAPLAPAPFASSYEAGVAQLSWYPNAEADLEHYRVHRGTSLDFVPSPATWFATVDGTSFEDSPGRPYVYKVVAVDAHGNESPAATFSMGGNVDVAPQAVHALAFAPPSPNPARGATTLRFALPQDADVRLELFDASGRRVRGIEQSHRPAGEHEVTLALRDDRGRALGDGLYFVRFATGGRVFTRRIVAVH